jgi:hypothetical protein
MEEAPENGKESSHSAHANGMNEYYIIIILWDHRRICGSSLTETSLCRAYLYLDSQFTGSQTFYVQYHMNNRKWFTASTEVSDGDLTARTRNVI